jgi:hypothetical protein
VPVNEWKNSPKTQEFEEKAKNLLKGEIKRRGLTYGQLVEKLAAIGVQESERNLNNKISRGGVHRSISAPMLRSDWASYSTGERS